MMAFLHQQLMRVEHMAKLPNARSDESDRFKETFEKGHRLLAKHSALFDIRTFYKIDQVRRSVNTICKILKQEVQKWQVDSEMKIEDCVPYDCVEEDRKHLQKLLAYVLRGTESGVVDGLLQKWREVKERHAEAMGSLQIIEESDLVLGQEIDEGGYGRVHQAQWHYTKVAVKIPHRSRDLPIEEFALFVKEAMIHGRLFHPNIAQVYAATASGWLVMERADTDLGTMCHGKEVHDWRITIDILRQATEGLYYLHSLDPPVVHSDVKTSNFLVFRKKASDYRVKVTDFGLACESGESRSKSVRTGTGTLEWMAPELFEGKPTSVSSDVYSLGIVMYEVLTGQYPYGTDALGRGFNLQAMLMHKKLVLAEDPCTLGPEHCPRDMQSFLQRCLSLDPDKRPSMEEISKYLRELPLDWSPSSQPADKIHEQLERIETVLLSTDEIVSADHSGVTVDDMSAFGLWVDKEGAAGGDPGEASTDPERRKVILLSQKLSSLTEGAQFTSRYTIERERFLGAGNVVLFAKNNFSKREVVLKFYHDEAAFNRESDVHSRLGGQHTPRLEDAVPSADSGGLPNALAFQRGDYTMEHFMAGTSLTQMMLKSALHEILLALEDLHKHKIVHRDLKPSNVMFFSGEQRWKLTDLGSWAAAGQAWPLSYTLMYAPPEVVAADMRGKKEVAMETSADMWTFGIMAYELATGMRFFGPDPTDEQVRQKILGFQKMPDLSAIGDRSLRRLISKSLRRDPQKRWTASKALANAYFRSADYNMVVKL